jgi:hypothetical protein
VSLYADTPKSSIFGRVAEHVISRRLVGATEQRTMRLFGHSVTSGGTQSAVVHFLHDRSPTLHPVFRLDVKLAEKMSDCVTKKTLITTKWLIFMTYKR